MSLSKLYPVVTMHGILESDHSMNKFVKFVKEVIPGLYVKNCEIGTFGRIASMSYPLRMQIDRLSECINSDPNLKDGFIGVGFSNGGMLMRGYLQLYNHQLFKMVRFIGLSSPLGGQFCGANSKCFLTKLPWVANLLLNGLVYERSTQEHLGPASYWRDPNEVTKFNEVTLLAELDCLKPNQTNRRQLKRNFMSVDKLILYGSEKDMIITPWNSAWFGTWGMTDRQMLFAEQRPDYDADNFGLKSMTTQGRVIKLNSGMFHLGLITNKDWIQKEMPQWLAMEMKK